MNQRACRTEDIDRVLEDALALPPIHADEGPTLSVAAPVLRSLVVASASVEPEPTSSPTSTPDVFSATTRRSPAIIVVDTDERTRRIVVAIWALAAVLFLWLAWEVYEAATRS